MLDELHTASSLLGTAVKRYVDACSGLRDGHLHKNSINNTAELLGSLTNEIDLGELYKNLVIQAQTNVKQARNLAGVPINQLPAEVMDYIFQLVLAQQPCPLRTISHWSSESPVLIPRYPDTFTHVCSRWRQIALASRGLWSHIDIALSCPLTKGFCDRAETYVARARHSQLDIHFIDPGSIQSIERSIDSDDDSEQESSDPDGEGEGDEWVDWSTSIYKSNPKEFTFLASSSQPRIISLGLFVRYRYHPIHSRALEHCLINCPSGLSELVIDVPNGKPLIPSFFDVSPDLAHPENADSTPLSLPAQQLENSWGSVAALVLRGRYLRWSSTAYHRLTELRLLGDQMISLGELAGVFKASPGLRIFCCGFKIRRALRSKNSIPPFALQELEVLNLYGMPHNDIYYLLRRLIPGPKPLRLLLHGDPTFKVLGDFFVRSNVQEMRVESRFSFIADPETSLEYFHLPPQLRILVLVHRGWGLCRKTRKSTRHDKALLPTEDIVSNPIELDALYMLACRYDDFNEFREIVEKYSPQRLVLWNCHIKERSDPSAPSVDMSFLESVLGNELSRFCPSIECLSAQDPKPLQDWD